MLKFSSTYWWICLKAERAIWNNFAITTYHDRLFHNMCPLGRKPSNASVVLLSIITLDATCTWSYLTMEAMSWPPAAPALAILPPHPSPSKPKKSIVFSSNMYLEWPLYLIVIIKSSNLIWSVSQILHATWPNSPVYPLKWGYINRWLYGQYTEQKLIVLVSYWNSDNFPGIKLIPPHLDFTPISSTLWRRHEKKWDTLWMM